MFGRICLMVGLMSMVCSSFELFAQESGNDPSPGIPPSGDPAVTETAAAQSDWDPTTSLFLELLGKGWYSVNVDFRKKATSSFSLGIQIAEEIWPSVMIYRFLGERHRLETGGGVSVIIAKDGFEGMSVHGVLGYRYQKKGGLIFRAGFTPLIGIPFRESGDFAIIPFPGVSLGYSF